MKIFLLTIWALVAAIILLGGVADFIKYGFPPYGYFIAAAVMYVLLRIIFAGHPRQSKNPNYQELGFWFGWILLFIAAEIFRNSYVVLSTGNYYTQASGGSKARALAHIINFVGDELGPIGATSVYAAMGLLVAYFGLLLISKNLTSRSSRRRTGAA